MNLQQYVIKHGTARLYVLAKMINKKPRYLINLLYAKNISPENPKLPSLQTAKLIVEASGREISYEGLANPVEMSKNQGERTRVKKGLLKEIEQSL